MSFTRTVSPISVRVRLLRRNGVSKTTSFPTNASPHNASRVRLLSRNVGQNKEIDANQE